MEAVIGPSVPITTGQNCFRFLVPTEMARANPITHKFVTEVSIETMEAFAAPDHRMVIYPCRNGELLNFVAIHPAKESSEAGESSWLTNGSVLELQRVYKEFGPTMREFCKMAEDVKLWELSTRAPISTFFEGKVVLVGDAAHPTLPRMYLLLFTCY